MEVVLRTPHVLEGEPNAAWFQLDGLARYDLVFEMKSAQVFEGHVERLRGVIGDAARRHGGVRSFVRFGMGMRMGLVYKR